MRVNDSYKTINVAAQRAHANSVLSHWKKLLKLRKKWRDVLVYGEFKSLSISSEKIVAWKRWNPDGTVAVVVMNFTKDAVRWNVDAEVQKTVKEGEVIVEAGEVKVEGGVVALEGYGAAVFVMGTPCD
jgi:oligo-1,6-glucosidase